MVGIEGQEYDIGHIGWDVDPNVRHILKIPERLYSSFKGFVCTNSKDLRTESFRILVPNIDEVGLFAYFWKIFAVSTAC